MEAGARSSAANTRAVIVTTLNAMQANRSPSRASPARRHRRYACRTANTLSTPKNTNNAHHTLKSCTGTTR